MYNFKALIDDVTIRHEITKVPLGLKYVKTQALQIYDFYFDGSDTSLENLGHSHTQLCMVQWREIGERTGFCKEHP